MSICPELPDTRFKGGFINDDGAAFDVGFERNWIATAGSPNTADDDLRIAVLADDFVPLLVVALGTADGAGVIGNGERVIRFRHDDEANVDALVLYDETMKVAVIHGGDRNVHGGVLK